MFSHVEPSVGRWRAPTGVSPPCVLAPAWRPGLAARHDGAAMTLTERLPPPPPEGDPDADDVYAAIEAWAADDGLRLYPHQEEALLEVATGANVILSTPTGSGKSLVAIGAHAFALAGDRTYVLHSADQGAGVREVLRAVRRSSARPTSA